MSEHKLVEVSERLARREERMNTRQAKHDGALDGLYADMAKRDAEREEYWAKREAETAKWDAARKEYWAKRDAEMAKREADRQAELARWDREKTCWLIGMWITAIVVVVFSLR